ncbi:MAG: hypothetical protein LBU04_04570 [Christensenellaceae bacterium]|nr:hypothetical protein [Christensenellaceae bacterium]
MKYCPNENQKKYCSEYFDIIKHGNDRGFDIQFNKTSINETTEMKEVFALFTTDMNAKS